MSDRSETPEYNLYYEEDGEFEYDPWETDLDEVRYFLTNLTEDDPDAAAQAILVRRTRVVFHTDWEPLESEPTTADAEDDFLDDARLAAEVADVTGGSFTAADLPWNRA